MQINLSDFIVVRSEWLYNVAWPVFQGRSGETESDKLSFLTFYEIRDDYYLITWHNLENFWFFPAIIAVSWRILKLISEFQFLVISLAVMCKFRNMDRAVLP